MMRILKNVKILLVLIGLKELKLSPVRQDVTVLTNGEPKPEILYSPYTRELSYFLTHDFANFWSEVRY